jgi:hypothetical protein
VAPTLATIAIMLAAADYSNLFSKTGPEFHRSKMSLYHSKAVVVTVKGCLYILQLA